MTNYHNLIDEDMSQEEPNVLDDIFGTLRLTDKDIDMLAKIEEEAHSTCPNCGSRRPTWNGFCGGVCEYNWHSGK